MEKADFEIGVDLSKWPLSVRLRLDSGRVSAAVGRKVAAAVRRRIRAGIGLRSGQTLNESGRLIRSISYNKRIGIVAPNFRSREDVSKRVKNNYALMLVHIYGKYKKNAYRLGRGYRSEYSDPMGTNDRSMWKDIEKWTEDAIAKELKSGKSGLIMELRRNAFKKRAA